MTEPEAAVVLLSVRPPHVDRLLDGTKTVELRRRDWRVRPGSVVLLYASGDRRALVGSLVVEATDVGMLDAIWGRYGDQVGLTQREFDDYYAGARAAIAIPVRSPRRLEKPVRLDELRRRWPTFTAPQSFRYLAADELAQILNGERRDLLP